MAAPTPSQIKDRIVTMCPSIAGVTTAVDAWPNDDNPFTAAELGAIVVRLGLGTPNPINATSFRMSRVVQFIILARRFTKDYKLTDQVAWEALEPLMLAIPLYFQQHPRLEYNDSGLALSITLPQEREIAPLAFKGALYASMVMEMTVQTIHS